MKTPYMKLQHMYINVQTKLVILVYKPYLPILEPVFMVYECYNNHIIIIQSIQSLYFSVPGILNYLSFTILIPSNRLNLMYCMILGQCANLFLI